MQAKTLIETLLEHSQELHPGYSQSDHKTWALGFLASIVLEGINNDNRLWHKLQQRIDRLHDIN